MSQWKVTRDLSVVQHREGSILQEVSTLVLCVLLVAVGDEKRRAKNGLSVS